MPGDDHPKISNTLKDDIPLLSKSNNCVTSTLFFFSRSFIADSTTYKRVEKTVVYVDAKSGE